MTNNKCVERPGNGYAVASLSRLLRRQNVRRVLLITGKSSYEESGAADCITNQLDDFHVTHIRATELLNRWQKIYTVSKSIDWNQYQVIVSVGGGKTLDFAKSLNYAHASGIENISDVVDDSNWLHEPLPIVAIPLTAGSGSEATQFAVVFDDGVKHSIDHPSLQPRHVIHESSFLTSCPAHYRAAALFDALCHAIESGWAMAATTASREHSLRALERLSVVVHTKPSKLRYSYLLWAMGGAHTAGMAINVTRTTAAHALSYSFTHDLGVPHGEMVARLLPHFVEHIERAPRHVIRHPLGPEFIDDWICTVRNLLNFGNHPFMARWYDLMRLHDLDVDQFPGPATDDGSTPGLHRINPERLANHPVTLETSELNDILYHIQNEPGDSHRPSN